MKLFKKSHNKLNAFNKNCEENIQNDDEAKRQQLQNQFYKIIKSYLIISQIFISAPMGLQKPKSDPQRLSRDLLLYRLHIVWCLTVYSLLVYAVYDEYNSSHMELPTVQMPLYFSEYFLYLIHVLELIRMITFRHEMFRILQLFLLDFDQILIDMKVRIHYDDLQNFLGLHTALILVHFIICTTLSYLMSCCKIGKFLMGTTVYVLPNVIINISLLQYYALLYIIYKREDKLYFLLETLLITSSCTDDTRICKFRHQLNFIRSLYAKLDEFTKNVNDHFSTSICLVYFGSFINISVNLYFLYKNFNEWEKSTVAGTSYSVALVFMHIGKMFLILYYNQKVQNMKIKASLLLSSLKFEYQGAETTLRLFILQLLSDTRSNYVCGMAALNMNCIISLLVGISTLSIFLVQYDITFEALKTTHNAIK